MGIMASLHIQGTLAAGNCSHFGAATLPTGAPVASELKHIDLHKTQIEVSENLGRFNTVVTGRRWGKSILDIWFGCSSALGLLPDVPKFPYNPLAPSTVVFAMPEKNQCRARYWFPILHLLGDNPLLQQANKAEATFYLRGDFPDIVLVGLNDGDGDRIRGKRIVAFVGDEWQDVKPHVWDEVIRPAMSDTPGSVAIFSGTPKGKANILKRFDDYQDNLDGWKSFKYETIDNPHIDPNEIEIARATLEPRVFRQEYQASYEDFPGQFFEGLEEDALQPPPEVFQKVILGVDWGDINPALAVCALDNDHNWWILDTWYQAGPSAVGDEEFLSAAQEFVKKYGFSRSWAGHDRPASIQKWNRDLGCKCASWQDARPHRSKRHPSVSEATSMLANLFVKKRLRIAEPLTDLYDKLKGYHRKKAKYGGFLDEAESGQDDHEIDAIRYAIGSEEFGWTPRVRINRGTVRR